MTQNALRDEADTPPVSDHYHRRHVRALALSTSRVPELGVAGHPLMALVNILWNSGALLRHI
jgi:hypothetical protein